jgi:hypothetical protein
MSLGSWTTIVGHLQGDISYTLRKILVTSIYIDFELILFGEKWPEVDLAFEYRFSDKDTWFTDAVIIGSTSNYLKGNKLLGLTVSKYGTTHSIRWKYSDNNLIYGQEPQIRLRVLPRIRVFSSAGKNYHSVSSEYGESLVDLDGVSRHDCIGINNSGQYMCLGSSTFYIIDSLDTEEESTSSYSSSSSSLAGCEGVYCAVDFTSDILANGEYNWTGGYYNSLPIYHNGNYYLSFWGGVWRISFSPPSGGPATIYYATSITSCPEAVYSFMGPPVPEGNIYVGDCSISSSSSLS